MSTVKVTIPGIRPGQRYEVVVTLYDDTHGTVIGQARQQLRGKSSMPYTLSLEVPPTPDAPQ